MAEKPNPFDELMKLSKEWTASMGQAGGAFDLGAWEKLWPTMPKEALEAFMGKGASPEGLDAKTKLLLTLQGLIVQGALSEPQLRLTLRHAKETGATDQEVTETIALAAVFGGAAGATKAMELHAAMREDKE